MADKKTRTFQSTTLGVPALKMVLVHARNEAQNALVPPPHPAKEAREEEIAPVEKERAVRRIIEHLQASGE